jgi:DNA-binding transcriptional MocR family regulator
VDDRTLISEIEERMSAPSARGLAHAVSRGIRDGALPAGTRLPPVRTVARELALSPTTVSSAWRLLLTSGAITTAGRHGTRVSDSAGRGAARYRRALESATPFHLDLSTGVPDPTLLPSLASAIAEMTTAGTPSSYLDAPVLPELVSVLRSAWPYPPPEVTVVDGAMDGLDLVTRALLGFGDRVVVEHPCFPPIVDILEAAGMDVVGVPLDDEGLEADALAEILDSGPIRAVFLQPRGQNPTGASMTTGRAAELADLLGRTGVWIVEDDSTADLGVGPGISMGAHLPDQVVHIRSFSKSHGPDLRLAALSAPRDVIENLSGRRQLGQGWTSRLLQRILLHLLTDAEPIAQVAHARQTYADRRRALVEALAHHGVTVGGVEGLNLWVPVRDETAAVLRLGSQGVGVAPGQPFAVREEPRSFMRVSIGALTAGSVDLEEVALLLAEAATVGGWGTPGR